jgi:hypothetical protein
MAPLLLMLRITPDLSVLVPAHLAATAQGSALLSTRQGRLKVRAQKRCRSESERARQDLYPDAVLESESYFHRSAAGISNRCIAALCMLQRDIDIKGCLRSSQWSAPAFAMLAARVGQDHDSVLGYDLKYIEH